MNCKKIALILAMLMSVSALAACGDKSASSSSQQTEVTKSDDGREMVGNLYKTGLPVVKEKESFSLLIDGDADPEDMEIFQSMEKDTNIDIDWMVYPYDIAAEKKNLMYSSGDYPDVVGGWLLGADDIAKYGMNQGIFIPIEQHIADYAPRITTALDKFPDARQTMTTPDGHIYTIGLMGPQPLTRNVVHINKKWLEQEKLSIPKTTDELYAVLKVFKDKDMNGNGNASDEIPISTRGTSIGDLFGWFGLPAGGDNIQMQHGKPVFVPETDGFKEAVKYFAKLYAEGLLDVETFTQDNNQYAAKGNEADAIYGVCHDWSGSWVLGMERYMSDYTSLPVISSPNCSEPTYPQGDGWVFKTQMAVTKAAKNPATIIRFLDHVYDEDNSIQVKCGAYGNTYTRNEDGTLNEVPIPEGETFDSIRKRESLSAFPYAIFPEVNDLFPKTQEDINKKNIDNAYASGIIREKLPNYWLTAEESSQIATISTDISKYVTDQIALWISGEADIEKDWTAFHDQLKILGLESYMKVKSTAILRSIN